MLSEVMEHYGLALPFDEAGFFTTEHHQKVIRQVKAAIQAGRLVALSGLVGAGKTALVRQLQEELAREGKGWSPGRSRSTRSGSRSRP